MRALVGLHAVLFAAAFGCTRAPHPPEPAPPATLEAPLPPASRPAMPPLDTGNVAPAIPGFRAPTSLAPLVKAVQAGVVHIATASEGGGRSLGSGFIITPGGLVVTNAHVIAKAAEVVARLSDGRTFEARVIGRDPQTDLALLWLVRAPTLQAVTLGDSDALQVGDWVMAMGSPFGFDTSVSHGLVSARERIIGLGPYDDFLQTDALINPGNSGGPLFDMTGAVVGVTTAIVDQGQGVGFAVPINLVKDLLPNLLDDGRPQRGSLGIIAREVEEGASRFVEVTEVLPEGAGDKAGLLVGDRLVSVSGRKVDRYQQLLRRIALLGPGASVALGIVRARKASTLTATLSARPVARQ